MKQEIFRGIATALATPMDAGGAIDYEAYGRLIDWQIASGVAGLVACGTTAESVHHDRGGAPGGHPLYCGDGGGRVPVRPVTHRCLARFRDRARRRVPARPRSRRLQRAARRR